MRVANKFTTLSGVFMIYSKERKTKIEEKYNAPSNECGTHFLQSLIQKLINLHFFPSLSHNIYGNNNDSPGV